MLNGDNLHMFYFDEVGSKMLFSQIWIMETSKEDNMMMKSMFRHYHHDRQQRLICRDTRPH